MVSKKKLIAGAALGTFLGSLAAILYPKRNRIINTLKGQPVDFGEKARQYAEVLLNKGKFPLRQESRRESYLRGGILGLFLGAGTALLLAPKSGKQLRSQVSRTYNDISDKTEHVIHLFKNNSHRPFRSMGTKKKRRSLTSSRR